MLFTVIGGIWSCVVVNDTAGDGLRPRNIEPTRILEIANQSASCDNGRILGD